MDPHKRSVTIEVMTGEYRVVGGGRFATDGEGYAAMLRCVRAWPQRVWAIEGCQGIGRHVANRLLTDGEQVVDVPPKLSLGRGCSRPGRADTGRSFSSGRLRGTKSRGHGLDRRHPALQQDFAESALALSPASMLRGRGGRPGGWCGTSGRPEGYVLSARQ
ncbi:MAG: hypothetical protein WCG47_01555 [Dermatophilaceae bacterium]